MGSGGTRYFPHASARLKELIQESKEEADKARQETEINALLREAVSSFERDTETTQTYLDRIRKVLGQETEMVNFLFGGSVAKHTYVDGMSDIDSLVILDKAEYRDKSPKEVLHEFANILRDNLPMGKVKSIEEGRLAATVTYLDGTEIQLLPAMRKGRSVLISDSLGSAWKTISPTTFQRTLTSTNQKLSGMLIPVIKLFKSINGGLPEQKQLSGYHIEALAVDAVKNYRKSTTLKALLLHVIESSSARVLAPIADITGQSRIVDDYLGAAQSTKRRIASDSLKGIMRRLSTSRNVEDWRKLIID